MEISKALNKPWLLFAAILLLGFMIGFLVNKAIVPSNTFESCYQKALKVFKENEKAALGYCREQK